MSNNDQPANTGRNPAGQFEKGFSGNPKGRPPGIRNHAGRIIEALMAGDAEAIALTVVKSAKTGDMTAARIILDRLAPARRDNAIYFPIQNLKTAQDVADAMTSIVDGVCKGELSPSEGSQLSKILESCLKTLESLEFEKRLLALETRISEIAQ